MITTQIVEKYLECRRHFENQLHSSMIQCGMDMQNELEAIAKGIEASRSNVR